MQTKNQWKPHHRMVSQFHFVATVLFLMAPVSYGENSRVPSIRQKRALFPPASTVGLLAAIAFPIGNLIDDHEVVFSYNFEANYNSPAPGDLASLSALKKYGIGGGRSSSQGTAMNETVTETVKVRKHKKKAPKKRSLLSRKFVYGMLENKMSAMGLNGRQCLLKTICEVSAIVLGEHNGVLGDIVHIIFSPSSSRNDRILNDYYIAENRGYNGDCGAYDDSCPRSLLQYISVLS